MKGLSVFPSDTNSVFVGFKGGESLLCCFSTKWCDTKAVSIGVITDACNSLCTTAEKQRVFMCQILIFLKAPSPDRCASITEPRQRKKERGDVLIIINPPCSLNLSDVVKVCINLLFLLLKLLFRSMEQGRLHCFFPTMALIPILQHQHRVWQVFFHRAAAVCQKQYILFVSRLCR